MKRNNKKGFTLAELLIVVAIIAVLVAVAIPVFTTQLEKSRDAVSVANMRSAYAEAAVAVLDTPDTTSVTIENVVFKGTNNGDSYSGLAGDLPFTAPSEPAAGEHDLTFTFGTDGSVSCTM